MLKTLIYLGLFGLGLAWGLASPLGAAVATIQVYFVEPRVVAREAPFIRYQFWTSLVLLVSVALHGARGLPAKGREGRVLIAMWCYMAICLLSSLWAVTDSQQAFDQALEFSKTVLVAGLFSLVVRSRRDFDVLILACLVAVGHFAFLESIGKHRLDWVKEGAFILTDRHGSVLLLFLPLFLLLGVYGRQFEKVLCWLSLPLILDVIVRSNHRAYFLAMVVQFGLLLVFLPKRIVMRLSPILAAGVLLFVFVLTPDKYWTWMSTISDPHAEGSANSRYIINRASLEMLMDNPLGVGYENYASVMRKYLPENALGKDKTAHNTFFSVACEMGVPGFIAWSTAVFGAAWLFRRIRKRIDFAHIDRVALYSMGFEFGIYGCLIGDCFHSGHENDTLYWLVGFAVIATRLYFGPVGALQQPESAPLYDGNYYRGALQVPRVPALWARQG